MDRELQKAFSGLMQAVEKITELGEPFSDVTFRIFGTICEYPGVRQIDIPKMLLRPGQTMKDVPTRNTVSTHVNLLAGVGLVRPERSPHHHNGNVWFLTSTGESVAADMIKLARGAR